TELQAMISTYLQAMHERQELVSLNTKAKELYRVLIQPVGKHLTKSNLVIVPDEGLNSLPFAALVNQTYQRYLLEEYILSISPSASVLLELLERSQANRQKPVRSLLTISDPEFDRWLFPRLTRLPGAGEEIRELHSFYQVSEVLP